MAKSKSYGRVTYHVTRGTFAYDLLITVLYVKDCSLYTKISNMILINQINPVTKYRWQQIMKEWYHGLVLPTVWLYQLPHCDGKLFKPNLSPICNQTFTFILYCGSSELSFSRLVHVDCWYGFIIPIPVYQNVQSFHVIAIRERSFTILHTSCIHTYREVVTTIFIIMVYLQYIVPALFSRTKRGFVTAKKNNKW